MTGPGDLKFGYVEGTGEDSVQGGTVNTPVDAQPHSRDSGASSERISVHTSLARECTAVPGSSLVCECTAASVSASANLEGQNTTHVRGVLDSVVQKEPNFQDRVPV